LRRGQKPVLKRFRWPNVVATEGNVFPAERRDMSNKIVGNDLTACAQFGHGATEIDGIPADHGRDGEVDAGSPISLIFEGCGRGFRRGGERISPGERVASLTFVESGARALPQRRVADPIEGEEGTFETVDFPERLGQSILLGIAANRRINADGATVLALIHAARRSVSSQFSPMIRKSTVPPIIGVSAE
jgi:hypothetical protein